MGLSWEIDDDFALTAQTRALLTSRYGYTANAGHNRGVVVKVMLVTPGSESCLTMFATSLDTATADAAAVKNAIAAEARTRVDALVTAAGLAALRGRRFPL